MALPAGDARRNSRLEAASACSVVMLNWRQSMRDDGLSKMSMRPPAVNYSCRQAGRRASAADEIDKWRKRLIVAMKE